MYVCLFSIYLIALDRVVVRDHIIVHIFQHTRIHFRTRQLGQEVDLGVVQQQVAGVANVDGGFFLVTGQHPQHDASACQVGDNLVS